MVELSVDKTTLPEVLAAIAEGHDVVLRSGKQCVAVVSPSVTRPKPAQSSFAEAMAEFRSRCDVTEIGVTDDEVHSWRDKSPGREAPF